MYYRRSRRRSSAELTRSQVKSKKVKNFMILSNSQNEKAEELRRMRSNNAMHASKAHGASSDHRPCIDAERQWSQTKCVLATTSPFSTCRRTKDERIPNGNMYELLLKNSIVSLQLKFILFFTHWQTLDDDETKSFLATKFGNPQDLKMIQSTFTCLAIFLALIAIHRNGSTTVNHQFLRNKLTIELLYNFKIICNLTRKHHAHVHFVYFFQT